MQDDGSQPKQGVTADRVDDGVNNGAGTRWLPVARMGQAKICRENGEQ